MRCIFIYRVYQAASSFSSWRLVAVSLLCVLSFCFRGCVCAFVLSVVCVVFFRVFLSGVFLACVVSGGSES